MADNTVNGLLATARSLETVVAGAISSDNELAAQQVSLAIGYIRHVAGCYPFSLDRSRLECREYTDLAKDLAREHDTQTSAIDGSLSDTVREAERVLDDPSASLRDIERACGQLRSHLAAIVRSSSDGEIERRVVMSGGRIARAMATWFVSLGWGDSGDRPTIEELYTTDE